jgi:putative addiction module component (TIGR02574 family)
VFKGYLGEILAAMAFQFDPGRSASYRLYPRLRVSNHSDHLDRVLLAVAIPLHCGNLISIMIAERIPELRELTAQEKLILVGEIWDELAANPDVFPPRADHIEILRQRVEEYQRNPADLRAWDEVKQRILNSR